MTPQQRLFCHARSVWKSDQWPWQFCTQLCRSFSWWSYELRSFKIPTSTSLHHRSDVIEELVLLLVVFALGLRFPPSLSEAPASTLHHFAEVARAEVEPTSGLGREHCRKNASRDAHAFIQRWGLSWKVPLSFVDLGMEGEMNKFAYIKPSDFLKFLIQRAPDLLMGGCPNIDEGKASLCEFWKAYRGFHPTHRLFCEQHQSRSMETTFALAFHGDEGRGLKKGNTTILMMETCLGADSWSKFVHGKSSLTCDSCDLDEPTRKRIKTNSSGVRPAAASHVCYQSTNLKEHSFLTKFVLAAIPKKEKSVLDAILLEIIRDFNSLFDVGFSAWGCQWFAACTGAKGDLKWVQRVGQLNRCFGSQTSINKAMCHECLAGTSDLPFEDHVHCPCWAPTCFTRRPYDVRPVLCHIPFEHQPENEEDAPHERFYRRDIFHNTKQGVFRYFVASCVMLILKLRYFDDPGGSNRRDVVLDRAYNHFKWFCSTTGRSPALRSFSLSFFNSPNWFTYPWVNCKGSDTSHLLAWVHTMLVGFMNDPLKEEHMAILEQMIAAANAARKFQRICYSHNLWLNKFCAGSMYKHLHAFVAHYNGCAFLAMRQWQYTGFALTSKYHLLCHQKLETLRLLEDETVAWVPNPQLFGCEMNEDVVGRLSRLIRRVSARTASSRALQLYLIKSKAVYRRFKVKQAKLKVKPGRWDLGGPAFSHPKGSRKKRSTPAVAREDWGWFINVDRALPVQWIR